MRNTTLPSGARASFHAISTPERSSPLGSLQLGSLPQAPDAVTQASDGGLERSEIGPAGIGLHLGRELRLDLVDPALDDAGREWPHEQAIELRDIACRTRRDERLQQPVTRGRP